MSVALDTKIGGLRQGEHLCSVYESTEEMLMQAVPYVKHGLTNGEQCIYVADENSVATVRRALERGGVDVQAALSRGQLKFWGRAEYRQPGDFSLPVMKRFIQHTLREGVELGYNGIRLAVEMTWTIDCGVSHDDLVKWEDLINSISYPGSQISFLCQYNARALSRDLVRTAVYVHPVVVLGHEVCPNLQYRPAAQVLADGASDGLETLLARLRAGTGARAADAGAVAGLSDDDRPDPRDDSARVVTPPAPALADVYATVERVLGSLPVGVYICEAPSGVVMYYNAWMQQIWGRGPRIGDPSERFCGAMKLYRPDGSDLPHDECPMAVAIRKGIGIQNAEAVVERPDGSRSDVLVNITPIRDHEGRVIGAVNFVMDVTERKRAEAVRDELVQSLEQSKAELQEKIQELEKFEDAVVGRELRMMELERENRELRRRLEEHVPSL